MSTATHAAPSAIPTSYLLACSQPHVAITRQLHVLVYRWCRDPQMRDRLSARGRHLICGSFVAYPAVVDDFGSLVRVAA